MAVMASLLSVKCVSIMIWRKTSVIIILRVLHKNASNYMSLLRISFRLCIIWVVSLVWIWHNKNLTDTPLQKRLFSSKLMSESSVWVFSPVLLELISCFTWVGIIASVFWLSNFKKLNRLGYGTFLALFNGVFLNRKSTLSNLSWVKKLFTLFPTGTDTTRLLSKDTRYTQNI